MDANKILGVLLQSGMRRSGTSRAQRLAGSGQGGGGLASIAGALLGGGGQGGGGGIAGALLGGGSRGGSGGGIADIAGALLGGGSGRASGGVAASGGAMAILSSLAGVAMQHFGSAQGSPGLAEEAAAYDTGDGAADPDSRATVMIRAMITAAKADGEIDPQEKQRILGRLEEAGADPDARAFVQAEMAKPVDVDAIVRAVGSPQMAVEAYTASLFAIDVDTPAEADYMRELAMSLRLDPVLVRSLHQSLEPAA